MAYYSKYCSVYSGCWKFLWDFQLGGNIQVGHDLWQPPKMLVGQKTSLTDHFLMYRKFENAIRFHHISNKEVVQENEKSRTVEHIRTKSGLLDDPLGAMALRPWGSHHFPNFVANPIFEKIQ